MSIISRIYNHSQSNINQLHY